MTFMMELKLKKYLYNYCIAVQGYGPDMVHKPAWAPQPQLLAPLDAQKPLDIKHLKPEIKLEPTDAHKRSHPEAEIMVQLFL